MKLPLLHCSTQMAMLKKLIRRKVRELRWRKHRAQRRLKKIRKFRWELLRLMQRLIDLRQHEAERGRREQARRAVDGMLHMYKRWLGNWTTSIKSQNRLIRQEEQLKRGLSRRLRLLRKRLRKHHRPKHLVDSCFKKLARAVKRWQQRPDYRQYIEGQELIWAQEVEEVQRYLSDIRQKSPKRRNASRRKRGLHFDLPDFSSFWQFEMQKGRPKRTVSKIQKPRKESPLEWERYRAPRPSLRSPRRSENKPSSSDILINLDDLDEDQKRRRKREISTRKVREKDQLGPSLKEMQQLLIRLLNVQNPAERRIGTVYARNSKSNRNLKRKPAKTDLYQDLEKATDNTEEIPPSQRKRQAKNQEENSRKDLMESKVLSDNADIPAARKNRMKKINRKSEKKRSKTHSTLDDDNESQLTDDQIFGQDSVASLSESQKNLILESRPGRKSYFRKSLFDWVVPVSRESKVKRQTMLSGSTYQSLRRSNSRPSDSLSVLSRRSTRLSSRGAASSPSMSVRGSENVDIVRKQKKPSSKSTDESRIRSYYKGIKKFYSTADNEPNSEQNNEQNNEQKVNLPFVYQPIYTTSPKNVYHDQNIKKDVRKVNKGKSRISLQPVGPQSVNQNNDEDINTTSPGQDRAKTDREEFVKNINNELLPHEFRPSNSHSKTLAADMEAITGLKTVQKDDTTSLAVSSKFKLSSLQSDPKYKKVQYFLKDIIESNPIMERSPDIEELMNAVGKHYMWDNLSELHGELLSGGINKPDVKRRLTHKYLGFLKTVQIGLIKDPNKPSGSAASEQTAKRQSDYEHLHNLKYWYRHRLSTRPMPLGSQGITEGATDVQSQKNIPNMKTSIYQNIFMQEVKAERRKRDKWDERLRRLLPTSETSASMSLGSTNTMGEVEPDEEEDLRTIDKRYSLTNLKRMMDEHEARFKAMESKRISKSESQIEEPPPKSESSKKPEKRQLRPIHQLFYSPRKTCRVQKMMKLYSEYSEDEQDSEALEEGKVDQNACTEKCPKCGKKVQVPCYIPSSKASSAILSSGSIEACAKNELLANTMADVCTRCGYVHDEGKPCSQPAEDRGKTTILRLIK
ncbi:hypothetical protein KR032_009661, partial [Drosophila birchii]